MKKRFRQGLSCTRALLLAGLSLLSTVAGAQMVGDSAQGAAAHPGFVEESRTVDPSQAVDPPRAVDSPQAVDSSQAVNSPRAVDSPQAVNSPRALISPPTDALQALDCVPEQTGGFHDYPEGEERYEPALFHSRPFALEENIVFMLNLGAEEGAPDLYLTLTSAGEGEEAEPVQTELECRRVRGADGSLGYSCVNLPPSEMLLINASSLRFTRTAVGGWTFAGASDSTSGDSIFVEYGQCQPQGTGN